MIPVLLLAGLVLGRWWRGLLPVATLMWPLVLLVVGVTSEPGALAVGAALALANTAAGVLLNRAVASLLHHLLGGTAAATRH